MTAHRYGLAVALASALVGCATPVRWTRRHDLPPPARESRAGAPERSAGPAPGFERPAASATAISTPTATATSTPTATRTAVKGPAAAADTAKASPEVTRAVEAATSLVGRRTIVLDGVDYGPDCAALVRAAFARAGHPLPPEVRDAAAVHALAERRGALTATRRPARGDLVFLADRPGGPPAHVGLVARAEPDGTAFVLHRVARGVQRVRVNLAYPERPVDPGTGKHINDTLMIGARPVPAGSLVVGVSDLLRHG